MPEFYNSGAKFILLSYDDRVWCGEESPERRQFVEQFRPQLPFRFIADEPAVYGEFMIHGNTFSQYHFGVADQGNS